MGLPKRLKPLRQFSERDIEYEFLFGALQHVKGRDVLDIGTGDSGMYFMLRQCGFIPKCVDIKPAYPWVTRRDARDLKMSTATFDGVTCISTLEHIPEPKKAVREMIRVLKHEGILIVSFPYHKDRHMDTVNHKSLTAVFNETDLTTWFGDMKEVGRLYWRQWTGSVWRDGKRMRRAEKVDQHNAQGISVTLRK